MRQRNLVNANAPLLQHLDRPLITEIYYGTMGTQVEVQDLLRFLSRDAKIPLPTAMAKIKALQQASLTRYVHTT